MPDFRISFFKNVLSSDGHRFKCLQDQIDVLDAEDAGDAADRAERRFEILHQVPEWKLMADSVEVLAVDAGRLTNHRSMIETVAPKFVKSRPPTYKVRATSTAGLSHLTAKSRPPVRDLPLEQQLAELEVIYDAAPIGIFLCDRDCRFIRVNRHLALELMEISAAAHIGKTPWDLLPSLKNTLEPVLRRVLDAGETILKLEFACEMPKAPGLTCTCEASFYPIRDENEQVLAVAGIIDDVSDRKEAERARAEEQARLQRLLDANLFGVTIATPEGVISANDAFLDIIGISREEFVQHGTDWRKITAPELLPDNMARLKTLRDTGICPAFEKEYVRKDGTRIPVLIGGTLLDREPFRWIAFTLDLSKQKAREEQTRNLSRELAHRTKNLIAVVQAIAHHLAQRSGSVEEFEKQFGVRMQALAGIHGLMVQEDWRGAPVRDLVLTQLAHCADLVGKRIVLEGPPVSLTAESCQYIGMAINELCTNALKYGALSGDRGTVTIRWSLQPPERPVHFEMEWIEAGGPAAKSPRQYGFGHEVTTEIVARALDGKASHRFHRRGVHWSLAIPAACVVDSARPV